MFSIRGLAVRGLTRGLTVPRDRRGGRAAVPKEQKKKRIGVLPGQRDVDSDGYPVGRVGVVHEQLRSGADFMNQFKP
jgi:hypothetical protein